jgi:hypothetical protein
MLLLSQGCCFTQSLLFSYVLQEDSVKGSLFLFPVRRPNDMAFRPDVDQLATSVRTMRSFRPNAHQCLEASNSSRLHSSERNGKSSERSSEFEKNLAFKCIRPDDVVIPSGRHSMFDKY